MLTPSLEKIRNAYVSLALLCFNTALFLAILYGLLFCFYSVYEAHERNQMLERSRADLQAVYPGHTWEQILQIRRESSAQGYRFEPFTLFRDRPRRGQYVNVDENGFRPSAGQGPWPPQAANYNVFLFGGSVVFGWNLPDQETIASYLQVELGTVENKPVRVYNFGRSYYISTQERILFEQLLVAGIRPDAALFVDGMNDVNFLDGSPSFSPRFASLVEERTASVVLGLPMFGTARSLRNTLRAVGRWFSARGESGPDPAAEFLTAQKSAEIDRMIARYLANKSLVEAFTAANGIQAIFAWQPSFGYKYNLKYHPFAKDVSSLLAIHHQAYLRMDEKHQQSNWAADFIWCADIQEGLNEPLYVDGTHYSARMSRLVAQCIAQNVRQRNLLAPVAPRRLESRR
jgi:hypothetical protein